MRYDSDIARHVDKHGDGVRAIALWVDDARQAWLETTNRGARSIQAPTDAKTPTVSVTTSSIAAYGDTIHTFVERTHYTGAFLPGYQAVSHDHVARPVGLLHIDHIVGNVGWNSMNQWVDFYRDVMGFGLYQHFDDNDISTEYSALMSKVMANGNGYVKFPINEPAEGRRKSQIEEYLDFYDGPGVQHMALATNDILATVRNAASRASTSLPSPTPTTPSCNTASARSMSPSMNSKSSASLSTATTKATCSRFSLARRRPPHRLLRDHPAQRQPQLRQRQLQSAL